MPYNCWYLYTYQPILDMAKWSDLTADIEIKIVAIFSWMPQTIMAVSHRGKRLKFEIYDAQSIRDALAKVRDDFEKIKECELNDFDIARNDTVLANLCAALFPILGSVAASKYLHFSAPRLMPMWDRTMRIGAGLKDSAEGYIEYMTQFKYQLENAKNYRAAIKKCPDNAIRGWDIVCMERR